MPDFLIVGSTKFSLKYSLDHMAKTSWSRCKLNIVDVANEFVSRNSARSHILVDLSKILLLSFIVQLASKCILDTLKSQNFLGENAPDPPSHARCCAPRRAAFGSQISTPKTKSCLQP